jgi:hypothetical protein
MRWGEPSDEGIRQKFAFFPVKLCTGGYAWLEWVGCKAVSPWAHGVVGDIYEFTKLPKPKIERPNRIKVGHPSSPRPPKPEF